MTIQSNAGQEAHALGQEELSLLLHTADFYRQSTSPDGWYHLGSWSGKYYARRLWASFRLVTRNLVVFMRRLRLLARFGPDIEFA
jgi:hypothetical protein